ncbi:hypothetical protein K0M31_012794 [Melipona bicolor]|uniref:Uncharacterized protein n=1 Tax=Melipona bicolor TaxID=60889 RepID=A0AA40FJF0_9HYME|nr:hypothetical protein K0M31_012794 [Melipona bicolor]
MEGKIDRVQAGNEGSKYNRNIRYSHVIVYTGAAGYMSKCQTDDLLVAMTAARNTAQLVTLILTIVIPDLRISSNTTSEKQPLDMLDPVKINTKHNAEENLPAVDAAKSVLSYTLVNEQR